MLLFRTQIYKNNNDICHARSSRTSHYGGGVFQTGGRKLFFGRLAEKPISAPLSAALGVVIAYYKKK